MIEFQMPSLGADMQAGILREWFKKPGDPIKRGEIIADVETQKGIIAIEVFDDGVIDKLLIKENEKVPVGTVMALISPLGGDGRAKFAGKEERVQTKTAVRTRISPLAKKLADENHLDIKAIKGTGEHGAITRTDVETAIAFAGKAAPGTAENMRMAIASAMSRSNREIPHYYLESTIDMRNALEWIREKNKALPVTQRILPVAIIIKAIAAALVKYPDFNATWQNGLIRKERICVGIVISLKDGGIVSPAVVDADKKNISEIMISLADLIERARLGKLRSSELSESTITLTNLGDNSVQTVFGVIYPPQVALVGVGRINEEPWAENGMLDVRPVAHITLSADHRATDGHMGGRFLDAIQDLLSHPENL